MTHLLQFINENPNDWQTKLKTEIKVDVKKQDNYTLLLYQRKCDFKNPVVQECRGIILDADNRVVCCPFFKFGNYYEEFSSEIDWSSARVEEKLDGSIIKFWFDKDRWHVSSNSCVHFKLPFQVDTSQFDKECTYIFELIGKSNHLIIPYLKDELVHIGTRNNKTFEEMSIKLPGFKYPRTYELHSLQECQDYLAHSTEFLEGFVVVDKYWNRVKIKSARYLQSSQPSKKDIMLKLLKDEPFDDYPEHYFDAEKAKLQAIINDLPKRNDFKHRQDSLTEKEWLIKNINKFLKHL